MFRGSKEGKTLGMIDGDEVDALLVLDLRRRRRLRCLIMLLAAATSQYRKTESRCDDHLVLHE
jgi:hypothetical protein